MELILVRHTKVAVDGLCYGFSDVDLADSFIAEKDEVLKKVDSNDAVVISSSSSRCTKLASYISYDYSTDDRIKELNFGDWELKRWDDLSDPEFDVWMNDYVKYKCPNGESLLQMKGRVEDFYKELVSKNYQKVILVTHSGVVRIFHHLLKGIPLEDIFNVEIDYGGVHTFN